MTLLDTLAQIVGPGHVLTGNDAAAWSLDATRKYAWQPLAVVRPAATRDVAAIVQACAAARVAVVPVGGNTGLNGGTHAQDVVMLALDRMTRIVRLDAASRLAVVEAGVILSQLHDAAAAQGLAFPLTFGARGSARVGGFLSTNAGGSNVLRWGNARALCLGIEVVLADGRVMDLMSELHKDNTGYDLRDLFVGAEGTLGIITGAVLKLVPAARAHATALVAMPDLGAAAALLARLQDQTGGAVEAFEFMPDIYMARLRRFRPDLTVPITTGPVNIMLEAAAFAPPLADPLPDGTTPLASLVENVLAAGLEDGTVLDAALARTDAQRTAMWAIREVAAEITLNQHPLVDTDIAVPLGQVATFLTRMTARLAALDPGAEEMVVAHLGDGNVHYTAYPSRGDEALLLAIRAAVADEAHALRGSFSAEHGVGLSKLPTMAAMKDPVALDIMRRIRAALDPAGVLNPGKTIPLADQARA